MPPTSAILVHARKRPTKTVALLLFACIQCSLSDADELATLKANTDRWIELRSRLSQEKNRWDADKQILENSIATLEASKEAIERSVRFYNLENRKLNEERATAEEQLEAFHGSLDLLLTQVISYEKRIKNLATRLPPPLLERIRNLIVKIPASEESNTTSLPNRLQNLVAIMTIIDEFNNNLTLSHTIRNLDDGESLDVRVLFWGLASGYAIDATGTRAWVLSPGADGWQWNKADQHAPEITRLFDVYEKKIDPVIVNAPFQFSPMEADR